MPDVRNVVQQVIEEFVRAEQSKAEPAYKAELVEERKRREALETRLNVLVEENRKARVIAEEVDKSSQIRSELQRLGVAKVDLAFRAVKDEIARAEDGRLVARDGQEQRKSAGLPAKVRRRKSGTASGANSGRDRRTDHCRNSVPSSSGAVTLDKIKPGMNKDELGAGSSRNCAARLAGAEGFLIVRQIEARHDCQEV